MVREGWTGPQWWAGCVYGEISKFNTNLFKKQMERRHPQKATTPRNPNKSRPYTAKLFLLVSITLLSY
jgi:hypothetical protein